MCFVNSSMVVKLNFPFLVIALITIYINGAKCRDDECIWGSTSKYKTCLEIKGVKITEILTDETSISDVLAKKACNVWKESNDCHEQSIDNCLKKGNSARSDLAEKYENQIEGLKAIQKFWCDDNEKMMTKWGEVKNTRCSNEVAEEIGNCTRYFKIYSYGIHEKSINNEPDRISFEPPHRIKANLDLNKWDKATCNKRLEWSACVVAARRKCGKDIADFLKGYYLDVLRGYPSCVTHLGERLPSKTSAIKESEGSTISSSYFALSGVVLLLMYQTFNGI